MTRGYLVTITDSHGYPVHQYAVCEAHALDDGYAKYAVARGGEYTERDRRLGTVSVRPTPGGALIKCERCEPEECPL